MKININGVTREMTPEDLALLPQPGAETQIASLKQQLSATDYKAIKYAEGWISEEDYTPIKAERQALRDRINALELAQERK